MAIAEALALIGIYLLTFWGIVYAYEKAKEHNKQPYFWVFAISFIVLLNMIPIK